MLGLNMKIKYKNNLQDVLSLSLYTYIRMPLMIVLFVIIIISSSYVNFIELIGENEKLLLVTKFILIEGRDIFFIVLLVAVLMFLSVLSKKNKNYYLNKEISISNNGLFQISEFSKTELSWKAIQKIAKTKNHIFLYVNQISAYIVPRRAFQNQNDWESFYSKIMQFKNET